MPSVQRGVTKGDVPVSERRFPATFLERPNRFVAQVRLEDGREVCADASPCSATLTGAQGTSSSFIRPE